MREHSLGSKEVEVLHSVITKIKDKVTGVETTLYKSTCLIPTLGEDAFEIYTQFEVKRGKHRFEVLLTGRAKDVLKVKLRAAVEAGKNG